MIDIIIPCYNSQETIHRCLGSVLSQSSLLGCKVTLVHDGEDVYNLSYPLDIQELTYSENKGPGYARNYGLEHTSEKYVMFLDSDDMLANPFVLTTLCNNIKDYDFLIGNIAQVKADGSIKILKGNRNFLHGKIYSREFLEKNNIRFKECSCCEDSSFNLMCFCLSDNYTAMYFDAYAWMYNSNSLGRRDVLTWEFCTVPQALSENHAYVFEELKKRNYFNDKILFETTMAMIQAILIWIHNTHNYPQFKKENDAALRRFYKVYKEVQDKVSDELFRKAYETFQPNGNPDVDVPIVKEVLDSL